MPLLSLAQQCDVRALCAVGLKAQPWHTVRFKRRVRGGPSAQIPRTATVSLNSPQIEVTYEGDPKFVPIEGTDMLYAVNTAFAVIAVDGHIYVCHDGVWFDSDSPLGPWSVCANVPDVIYTIPPPAPSTM